MSEATSDTTGTMSSELECPNIFRHMARVRIVELQMQIDAEKLRAGCSHIHFIEKLRSRKAALRKLEDDIATIKLNANRSIGKLQDEFKLQWFLWRAALPISMVTHIPPSDILTGSRARGPVAARRLCLWLTWSTGMFSYYRIARVLGCDHTTVRFSTNIVNRALEDRGSELSLLLADVLDLEEDRTLEWPQKNHLRRSNRRRSGSA